MKADCRDIRELLGPYLDAELAEPERRRVEEHLQTCAECRQELAELEALHGLARKAAHPAPAEEHLDRLRMTVGRRLRRELRPEHSRLRSQPLSLFRLATVGGALVVMLVVVIAGYRLLGDRSARPGPLAETGLERRLAPTAPVEPAPGEPGFATGLEREERTAERARGRTRTETGSGSAGRMLAAGEARPHDEVRETARKDEVEAEAVAGARAEPSAPSAEAGAASARPSAAEPKPGVSAWWRVAPEEPDYAVPDRDGRSGCIAWPEPDTVLADTGTVELLLWVEPDSSVSSAEVVRSSGSPALDSFALRQALRARAAPGYRDGKPVRQQRLADFRQSAEQPDNR